MKFRFVIADSSAVLAEYNADDLDHAIRMFKDSEVAKYLDPETLCGVRVIVLEGGA